MLKKNSKNRIIGWDSLILTKLECSLSRFGQIGNYGFGFLYNKVITKTFRKIGFIKKKEWVEFEIIP